MEAVKLRSVRPFIMGSVCLEDSKISPHEEKEVEKFLEEKVKELIRKAKERGTNNKDPLVRLKVSGLKKGEFAKVPYLGSWGGKKKKKESPWRDLNSRPLVYKTSALTTELQRHALWCTPRAFI